MNIRKPRQSPPFPRTILVAPIRLTPRQARRALEIRLPARIHIFEQCVRENPHKDFWMAFHLARVFVCHIVVAARCVSGELAGDVACGGIVDVVHVHGHELVPTVVFVVVVLVVEGTGAMEPVGRFVLAPYDGDAFPVVSMPLN